MTCLFEIDLDDVFVEAGHGFGPPGFESEPPPVAGQAFGCRYSQRLPVSGGRHLPAPALLVSGRVERRD